MQKKVAVVTGGLSGIGKAVCEVLESENYNVIILSRSNVENKSNVILCDVSERNQVINAFNNIKKLTTKIDVLVNSAGFGCVGALELCNSNLIETIYKTNVFGTIYCIQQALPLMSAGGKIFNISSMQAISPVPFKSMYSSSKAAVSSLSYCLYNELKAAKIQVCCVCPGEIKTNFTKNRKGEVLTNKNYGNIIEKTIAAQDARESKRAPLKVVNKIFKKLVKQKKIKPLVIFPLKYKIIYYFSRILPINVYLASIRKSIIKK